jgi:hypothetical protein
MSNDNTLPMMQLSSAVPNNNDRDKALLASFDKALLASIEFAGKENTASSELVTPSVAGYLSTSQHSSKMFSNDGISIGSSEDKKPAARRVIEWPDSDTDDSINEVDIIRPKNQVIDLTGSDTDGDTATDDILNRMASAMPNPVIDLTASDSDVSFNMEAFGKRKPVVDLTESDTDDSFDRIAFSTPRPVFTRKHAKQKAKKRSRYVQIVDGLGDKSRRRTINELWFWKKHSIYKKRDSDSTSDLSY